MGTRPDSAFRCSRSIADTRPQPGPTVMTSGGSAQISERDDSHAVIRGFQSWMATRRGCWPPGAGLVIIS